MRLCEEARAALVYAAVTQPRVRRWNLYRPVHLLTDVEPPAVAMAFPSASGGPRLIQG